MPQISTFNVLGVNVSAINIQIAVEQIDAWIQSGQRRYVCVRDVHGIVQSLHAAKLRDIHNDAGLVTPDGMPLVWLGRFHGFAETDRVYGPDLLMAVCAHAARRGHRMFFFGGAPNIADKLAEVLKGKFDGLQVVGTYAPPFGDFSPDEDQRAVNAINAVRPDIVWVGLSTPKQEHWMAKHRSAINAAALIGIGAAFDFVSGTKRQAPRWIQRSGFEWVFRLATEPRRLARRYLLGHPIFVYHIIRQLLGRRYDTASSPSHGATS
jgi:N-acetylglucosaminyldiphosphoundecaprenol N-acetyl-beta-D-mannosaminyltransferase